MSRNASDAADDPSADEILRFSRVSMRYGRGPEVLSDVSLSLPRGSFHFVTGPSGAGKSSLLKLIYLAARPSSGAVRLFGEDVTNMAPKDQPKVRRRIGVVFQDLLLLDHLSAFDNTALPLRIAGHKPSEYRNDVAELLAWVGLGQRMHAMPPTLAGGEKQRLAIARAVVARPEILLADEPTGNLDEATADAVFAELLRVAREDGVGALIATHNGALADRMDRRILLHNGVIEAG